ncbi:MAG: winged helix-turn-helix domain-containing protein [Burkholderiales bacterium]|nr:winged helix-turn-helix domain-containing protein [Burkholderiales bacterium]
MLDTSRFELRRRGIALQAEPQVMELLALLVENSGRMLSKEEINEKIWRGRIVSDAALSSRIKSLRQILGDDGKTQQFVRTVHKKGFRFVAAVEPLDDTAAASVPTGDIAAEVALLTETASTLQAPQTSPLQARPAVAVLPFANLSSDAEQEYFSDGITADIITHLSKHRWLNVTARNTTFGYKGRSVDVRELGRELGVDYVVEGNIQCVGNRVRVSAQLIDAQTGHHKWAERYDREISDIFALQDEITETIVARVEPEIGFAERNRVVHSRPSNLQAWDCYHLGIHHFFKFTGEDNREAQRLLQQSHELDPRFGDAYAWWSYALILGMVYWDTPPTPALMDQALAAADKALSLDGQNATFHALKARVLLARCEYESAVLENTMAISLNPTFAAAHCGLGDSLAYEGRYQESIDCFEKAIGLSPNDPQLWAFYTYGALVLLFKQDFARALQWTERAINIPNCQYWTTAHQAVALAYLKRVDEARLAVARLLREKPSFSQAFAREKLFYLKKQDQIDLYMAGLELAGVPKR